MAEENPEDVATDAASSETPEAAPEPDLDDAEGESESTAGDPLAEAATEIENLQDRALRAQAELENVRRRAARDVENARKYALEKFTADLLPVLDSLEKAVEAVDAGAEDAKTLGEGVELSLKLFLSTCEKAGLIQVDPHGEPFDPQLHEAIAMVPNPDAEPNSVMEVMQKGYTLNGRLVRAARVVVVQGEDKQDD
ncbi:MAG: nucleotide exchange factor GrpE [Gammaproteobacteria bacterium]|nr:nucleotide exchange factor GrpE [Gammaproteobacteria bacterium]